MNANQWRAAVIAVTLVRPGPATPPPSPPPPPSPCQTTVARSDLFAVARAVIAGLDCGGGPTGDISPHATRVLPRRAGAFALVRLAIADPRCAPVVVAAEIQDRGDRRHHDILLTAFRRPDGGWFIDDFAVVD
jgi:hypothetical protein